MGKTLEAWWGIENDPTSNLWPMTIEFDDADNVKAVLVPSVDEDGQQRVIRLVPDDKE